MEPTPLKRVFFWATYTLGTLALVFGLLLAQVPRPRSDKDFRLEFATWGSCFLLLTICLLLTREILGARCREVDGEPGRVYSVFSLLGVAQLCVSLFALVSILVEVISR